MKRTTISFAAAILTILLSDQSAQAVQRIWANTGTDYNAGASWTGGIAPGLGDVGAFNAVEATQPNLTASLSNAGLYFVGAGSSGYDITRNNYIADSANLNIGFATDVGSNCIATGIGNGTLTVLSTIPEPATSMLLGFGLLLGVQRLRRKTR